MSPTRTGSLVWGVGPAFQLPTATDEALGQGKWGAGPAAGVLWFGKQWTFGVVINNIWSFGGDASRPAVNQMRLEPQVNYNFKDNPNRYLSFAPTIYANWQASGGERWTVPVSLGIGQTGEIRPPVRQFAGDGLLQCGRAKLMPPSGPWNWWCNFCFQNNCCRLRSRAVPVFCHPKIVTKNRSKTR